MGNHGFEIIIRGILIFRYSSFPQLFRGGCEEGSRLGTDPLSPACKAQMLLRRRLHADLPDVDSKRPGYVGPHLVYIRPEPGSLGDHSRIHIFDGPAVFLQNLRDTAGKTQGIRPLVSRITIRKMKPDIPEGRCAEQSVHNGMDQDIRIGMAEQTFFKGDIHSSQNESPALHKPVYIITGTYTHDNSSRSSSAWLWPSGYKHI